MMRTAPVLFMAIVGLHCNATTPVAVLDAGGTDAARPPPRDAAQPIHDASAKGPSDLAAAPKSLSERYPGDVGIDGDPALVFHEDFEEGSVAAVTARYSNFKNAGGMTLVGDRPTKSSGQNAIRFVAGGNQTATDLYRTFDQGYDELYYRWYAKYDRGIPWHHTGVWVGGYDPPTSFPSPQAGLKPNGDDRISVSIEPVFGIGGMSPRFDFYNYWMQMHSWMAQPMGNTAYYGNALVHQNGFTLDEEQWVCIEIHLKLNSDPSGGLGAMLEVWKNDALVQSFGETSPKGYWIRDKFCPQGADGTECTDYPAPADTLLDLQFRSSTALKLNYFWPQNYITDPSTGGVQYDDMIVATSRIGCLQ
jgi:hypothetical protein